jgi:predicted DNA-binding WGR domain protein
MSTTEITVDDKRSSALMKLVVDDLATFYGVKATVSVGSAVRAGTHITILPSVRGKLVLGLSQGGKSVILPTSVPEKDGAKRSRALAGLIGPYVHPARKKDVVIYENMAPKAFARALAKRLAALGIGTKLRAGDARNDENRHKHAWARLNLWFVRFWQKGDAQECALHGFDGAWSSDGQFTHKLHTVRVPIAEGEAGAQAKMIGWLVEKLVVMLGAFPAGMASATAPKRTKSTTSSKSGKNAQSTKATGAQRFEFRDGTSHKFWSASTSGPRLSVQFGRVGSDGQTKDRVYSSNALATAALQKLIAEKTAKGYVASDSSRPRATRETRSRA